MKSKWPLGLNIKGPPSVEVLVVIS